MEAVQLKFLRLHSHSSFQHITLSCTENQTSTAATDDLASQIIHLLGDSGKEIDSHFVTVSRKHSEVRLNDLWQFFWGGRCQHLSITVTVIQTTHSFYIVVHKASEKKKWNRLLSGTMHHICVRSESFYCDGNLWKETPVSKRSINHVSVQINQTLSELWELFNFSFCTIALQGKLHTFYSYGNKGDLIKQY